MKSFSLKKSIVVAGAMLAVSAQLSAATLEEIVVTAQFKEQSLQDTPVAITAFSSDMLEARSITEMYQVAASSPNVTMAPAGATFGSATAAFIRGIGQRDSGFISEPGVGMYIDDVYHPTLMGSMFDLIDLERVEVLRGPQGTLAGKNSIGGSVKMFSRKPSGDGPGYIGVTVGEFDRFDISAAGEFTLAEDKLFARVSAISKSTDGYIDRLDYSCATGNTVIDPATGAVVPSSASSGSCKLGTEGGKDVKAARIALRWLASDSVEVNFSADHSSDESESAGGVLSAVNSTPLAVVIPGFPFPLQQPANGTISPANPAWIPSDIYTTWSTYTNRSGRQAENQAAADSTGASFSVDWKIGDNFEFKSITSYREIEGRHTQEDGTPLPIQLNEYATNSESYSQEFRLSGVVANGRLNWTAGVFHFNYEADIRGTLIDIPYTYLGPFAPLGLLLPSNQETTTESSSAFVHAILALNDKMNFTAGVRYTDEEKEYTDILSGSPTQGFKDNNTDYRLVLDYHFNDDVMAYVQYATGYKGGGFSTRSFAPWQSGQTFGAETVDAYEFGLKSSLLDNTLRLNASVFLNDYADKQLTLGNCDFLAPASIPRPTGVPCALLTNAGDGEFKGVEIEIEWYPSENWAIDASFSTLDFEYTFVNPAAGFKQSNPIPFAPETQASLGVQYSYAMSSGATLAPRVDVTYSDEFVTNVTASHESVVDDATITNARLTWVSADKLWSTSLFVTNLTDENYFINHLANTINNPGLGTAVSLPSRPREWGLSIKRNF